MNSQSFLVASAQLRECFAIAGALGQDVFPQLHLRVPRLSLDGDRTEVEHHERIIWPVFQLAIANLRVALELTDPECLVDLAGVADRQIGPPRRFAPT